MQCKAMFQEKIVVADKAAGTMIKRSDCFQRRDFKMSQLLGFEDLDLSLLLLQEMGSGKAHVFVCSCLVHGLISRSQ